MRELGDFPHGMHEALVSHRVEREQDDGGLDLKHETPEREHEVTDAMAVEHAVPAQLPGIERGICESLSRATHDERTRITPWWTKLKSHMGRMENGHRASAQAP